MDCRLTFISMIFACPFHVIINCDSTDVDLRDILSDTLMPISILHINKSNRNISFDTIFDAQLSGSNFIADADSALKLMQFHRHMIQNYKCRNFLAKQILANVAPLSLHDRLGIANTDLNGKQ